MRNRAGFTLAETLVVVAVLAILSGIGFPVLHQAREKARQAGCAAHLAQIGKAVQMYSQDWDGFIPPYRMERIAGDLPRQNGLMLQAMAPYTRGPAVWVCPSDPLAGQAKMGTYAYHRWSSYVFTGPRDSSPLRLVDNPDPTGQRGPAQVAYAMDDTVFMVVAMTRTGPAVPRARIPGNHPRGANRLYFDGHVRFRGYPDLSRQR